MMITCTSTGSMSLLKGCLHTCTHPRARYCDSVYFDFFCFDPGWRSEPDVCYVHLPAVTVTRACVVRLGALVHLLAEDFCAREAGIISYLGENGCQVPLQ